MTDMFYSCISLNNVTATSVSTSTLSILVSALPTRTSNSYGIIKAINITDEITSSAESKFWNIKTIERHKVHLITINNNKVNKVYNLDKKLKISFYK
jgi:hypothetical protein